VIGPHRDEILLLCDGRPADQFGSEGQKRSVAIGLKMAQVEYLAQAHGSSPLLLIDDIMGELDASRRRALLPLLDRAARTHSQVFMTGTEEKWPKELDVNLRKWEVVSGTVRDRSKAV
jgi:DNA replication and repair protein RecF